MSNSQSQRPKGLISKLSSRSRRRRREHREEKIPIPSFSLTRSQLQSVEDEAAAKNALDTFTGASATNCTEFQPKVKAKENSGKENIPESRGSNNTSDYEIEKCNGSMAARYQAVTRQNNISIDDRDNSTINNGSLGVSAGLKVTSSKGEKSYISKNTCPLLPYANVDVQMSSVTEASESKSAVIDVSLPVHSSGKTKLKTELGTKCSSSSSNNSQVGEKRKSELSNVTKSVGADISRCNQSTSKSDLNAGKKFSVDGAILRGNGMISPKKQKTESTATAKPIKDCQKKLQLSCKIDTLTRATANSSNDNDDCKFIATHQHATDVDANQGTTSRNDQQSKEANTLLQSRRKQTKSNYFVSNDTGDSKGPDTKKTDTSQMKAETVAKKKGKMPATSSKSKVEVIDLNSDSDSSSSSDSSPRNPPQKKIGASKMTAAKIEEVESENISGKTKKSTTATRQKTTGVITKSTSAVEKKLCYACSTCKCNSRDGTSATPSKQKVTLSNSHARQERVLINRLQKIERNIQWMESQKHDVSRHLMKHRNTMIKEWGESNPAKSTSRPKFLADVDEKNGDELNHQLSPHKVGRANIMIFGGVKAKTAPKTTLTQHFGSSIKSETSPAKSVGSTDQDENNLTVEASLGPIFSPIDEEPETAKDELQKREACSRLTSMVDFAEAIAFSKGKGVSNWQAATTASAIAFKLDEFLASPCSKSSVASSGSSIGGLDELLQLFAYTPSKSEPEPACLHGELKSEAETCEQDGAGASQSVELLLTPRGKQIADDIQRSVSDEPEKLSAVERTCPEWRDNIKFAQQQSDPEQLGSALEAVKKAKSNIKCMKERIFLALMDREQTLELFEQSLERSMGRLKEE